jgi:hypothetical protein
MSSPYGRGNASSYNTVPAEPKKSRKGLIITIIIIVIIVIIIIIVIVLLSSKKSTPTPVLVKCTSNSQCLAPDKICNTATGVCVVCLGNSDCSAPTAICAGNTCVQCVSSTDCTSPATCKSGTCCDLTPPVIKTLSANLTVSSAITGTYTYSQQSVGTTATVTIYDASGVLLYTQPPNNILGTISVTEAGSGGVIFPNTTYGVAVLITNTTCGATAKSTIMQVSTVACSNEPTNPNFSSISVNGTVTTPLPYVNNMPGVQVALNYFTTNSGGMSVQSANAPNIRDISAGTATFGMIVYTTAGLEPSMAPMVVRGMKVQNFITEDPSNGYQYSFDVGSQWVGINPVAGTTYYCRLWYEPCPACTMGPTPGCISTLTPEHSFIAQT